MNMFHDLDQPHHCQLLHRKQAVTTRLFHPWAGDTFEHGVRQTVTDGPDKAGRKIVAGCLAGNYSYTQRLRSHRHSGKTPCLD